MGDRGLGELLAANLMVVVPVLGFLEVVASFLSRVMYLRRICMSEGLNGCALETRSE